jgi:hypothetical protein
MRSQFTDIYALLLRHADSLALSRHQTEQLQAQQKVLRARADSTFGALADTLARLPGDYDVKSAARKVKTTVDAMWEVIYAERDFLQKTLTPGQIILLPTGIRYIITDPQLRARFYAP